MKIVFFGGTFDPPHEGHLALADAVLEIMNKTVDSAPSCVADIYEAERAARETARSILKKYTR